MIVYGVWLYDELKDYIGWNASKRISGEPYIKLSTINHGTFNVKANTHGLRCFQKNNRCVACGVEGSIWALETHHKKTPPNLNLYAAVEPDKKYWGLTKDNSLLMTKDHIIPKSVGGLTIDKNLQTLCAICNQKKGTKVIEASQIPLIVERRKPQRGKPRTALINALRSVMYGPGKLYDGVMDLTLALAEYDSVQEPEYLLSKNRLIMALKGRHLLPDDAKSHLPE